MDTLNTPLTAQEAVEQLCQEHGLNKELLLGHLCKLPRSTPLQINQPFPGVIHLCPIPERTPHREEDRPTDYTLYFETDEIHGTDYACYEGNVKNLTELEEKELLRHLRERNWNNRSRELMLIKSYPITRQEQARRNQSAEDAEAITDFLTLNTPISLQKGVWQLSTLYSFFGDRAKLVRDMCEGFEEDDTITMTILIQNNTIHPVIIHLSRVRKPTQKPYGLTIYPQRSEGMEGVEYRWSSLPGTMGNLTVSEEEEVAQNIYKHHAGSTRQLELIALKKGTLTRDEAQELKKAMEADDYAFIHKPFSGWTKKQPEHVRYLFDKSIYGFETIDTWRQWKAECEAINVKAQKEWQANEKARRAEIEETIDPELRKKFPENWLPTQDTLKRIQTLAEDRWELVQTSKGSEQERNRQAGKLHNIVGSNDLDFRQHTHEVYDAEAKRGYADLYFARYQALEKLKAALSGIPI